jgi:5-methylthioadenosine/S-adenosylhomocysteine deaminase
VTEVSADWVLPVDGPPVEGGLVRYEDGAVVEVTTGRAERHHADAAIVPGFVNAHSHLEYAMYAGFGDGQAFGPWIATHVERKNRLEREDMVAIARLGVLESLRAGIATTADYSFSGAAATAATELGLRATV